MNRSYTRSIRLLLAALTLAFVALGEAQSNAPSIVVPPTRARVVYRDLRTVKSLRLMTYNLENLFFRAVPNSDGTVQPPKSHVDMLGAARAILESNPDIIVAEEVDNLEALTIFSERYLGPGLYRAALIEGNDERGIDIGFLIKSDLPLILNVQSNRDITWNDRFNQNKREPLFSRDLPMLYIRRSGTERVPSLIVIGNHGKSQNDRLNDKKSIGLRTRQYEVAAQLIDNQMRRWPGVPVVLMGDFNTDVRRGVEIIPFRQRLLDVFDILRIPPGMRVTQTFHPRNLPSVYDQLDTIYVSPSIAQDVEAGGIYRYKDARGRELPLPRTYEQREMNPSDHYPVVVDVSTRIIFPEAHQEPKAAGF